MKFISPCVKTSSWFLSIHDTETTDLSHMSLCRDMCVNKRTKEMSGMDFVRSVCGFTHKYNTVTFLCCLPLHICTYVHREITFTSHPVLYKCQLLPFVKICIFSDETSDSDHIFLITWLINTELWSVQSHVRCSDHVVCCHTSQQQRWRGS